MTDSKEITNKINISLDEALKCKTEEDIFTFINASDLAVNAIDEKKTFININKIYGDQITKETFRTN